MPVYASYGLFAAAAAILFWRLPVRAAILLTYFGGWLLLPVGDYRGLAAPGVFPWWIVGAALPSDMLVTKAWVAPVCAFAGASVAGRARLARWRPAPVDLPIALFCLLPLLGGPGAAPPAPTGIAYLAGTWGTPWLIGRIWLGDEEGRMGLLTAQALAGLALLPAAIMEGVGAPFLYDALYAPHPFRWDGAVRPFGYRPVALFEHGNEYGIAVALSAFAAIWLAGRDRRWTAAAALVALAALASQSQGAVLLLVVGLGMMAAWRHRGVRRAALVLVGLAAVAGAVHVTGVVPLQHIARDTAVGQRALRVVRGVGGGSFAWRVSQDTKVLAAIHRAPLLGAGRWDWWRSFGARPWGLAMLLLGQFGLIGLLLAAAVLIGPAALTLARRTAAEPAFPLATIVVLAALDALLNSFVYLPAILIAGALARPGPAVAPSDRLSPRREAPATDPSR